MHIPCHASEKNLGCLGYRMEYANTLSCLIGRFTAQNGNPCEQTSTMKSHKFSSWLIWRKQRYFLSSQTLYWPGNIPNDASFGHQRQDDAGGAFCKNVGHVGFEDMKENFCQVVLFQRFCFFLPLLGEDSIDFQIWLIFSNGLKVETNESADLQMVGVAMVLWDETNAWNCLFVVRLQMPSWNNASKRPGEGGTTIYSSGREDRILPPKKWFGPKLFDPQIEYFSPKKNVAAGLEDRILPLQPDLKIKYDFMVETVVYCI